MEIYHKKKSGHVHTYIKVDSPNGLIRNKIDINIISGDEMSLFLMEEFCIDKCSK